MAFCGKFCVEARRTRGAVEDLALEVACRQGEHPDVFVLDRPRERSYPASGWSLLAPVGRECLVEAADLTAALFGWIMPLPAALLASGTSP